MSRHVRVASTSVVVVRRELAQIHGQLLVRVQSGVREHAETSLRHETRERQRCLPGVHLRSQSHTHELDPVAHAHRLRQVARQEGHLRRGRDRKRLVRHLYRSRSRDVATTSRGREETKTRLGRHSTSTIVSRKTGYWYFFN